jgi:naringenin degradation protein FdeD
MTDAVLADPAAPAPGTALCTLAELAATGGRTLTFRAGERLFMMLVLRHDHGVAGYVNHCPHLGTPLNFLEHRFFSGDGARIQCATHGAQFEKATGLCIAGPCIGASLKPVAVEIDGETVRIAAPHG